MASRADQARLSRIRARHMDASTDWALVAMPRRAERISVRLAPGTEPVVIAVLTEDCSYQDRDFLLSAHDDVGFLLGLLGQAFQRIRELATQPPAPPRTDAAAKPADYAAECAMKCQEPIFIRYLVERHGLQAEDADSVKTCVREALAIASRSELNKSPDAAGRWRDMRADFEAWRAQ
ncbi:hypothetical protein [Rhizobium sp. CSW-27]|uniref:hypothetical protein n=1 Tax=Rhizobium sp. CSW-27 TaxID=2839985 RepID=UPI001C03008F|nr:hypothetical protein [Rhizobium sp. CSW-27]MBT9370310.1 hypothetical protein [Rhizobium sp. CSW-27]